MRAWILLGAALAGLWTSTTLAEEEPVLRFGEVLRDAKGGFDLLGVGSKEGYGGGYAGDAFGKRQALADLSNIVFIDRKSGASRLLLDKPAYIARLEPIERGAAGRLYLFSMALADSDQDGKIDERDQKLLYACKRDGSAYWPVTGLEAAPFWEIDAAEKDERVYVKQRYPGKGSLSMSLPHDGKVYLLKDAGLKTAVEAVPGALQARLKALQRSVKR